jgi:ABC-type lipoprotein release transport system permease subunit
LIGFGLATLILYDGLVIGMSDTFVKNTTQIFLGEAQIHREGFRQELDVDLVVSEWPEVERMLKQDSKVSAYAPRIIASGMLSSPYNVSAVTINGIDPERESTVSKVRQAVLTGEYLTQSSGTGILLGSRLARLLEVGLGDRVVLTAAQAGGGELVQELFRVSGIVEFGSRQMDQVMIFIPLARAQKLLRLGTDVHEVALRFHSLDDADDPMLPLRRALKGKGNELLSWKELMPQIKAVIEMSKYSTMIMGLILVAVISMSVINSMLMSIHERMFEFGVLKAVGTRPRNIALMILFEAGALAMISIAVGLVVGAAVSGWFSMTGFDFAGLEYAGTTLNEPIKTVLVSEQFILFPIFVLLLTVAAGIYPAVHAARLVPTQAMRRSL